jgi:hypothetical protein
MNLGPIRERASEHYVSPAYREAADQLAELLQSRRSVLRKTHIALDLEGVLASNKLVGLDVDRLDRLRRPLAQELLDTLSSLCEKLTIWTAANRGGGRKIIGSARLTLPQAPDYVNRGMYMMQIYRNSPELADLLLALENNEIQLPEGTPEEVTIHIGSVGVKIAQVLGVDHLFDDNAVLHRAACETLGLSGDAASLVDVEAFTLSSEAEVRGHYEERGLLKVVKKFVDQIG